MKFQLWLAGNFVFPLDWTTVHAAVAGRGLGVDSLLDELTDAEKYLTLADLMLIVSRPSMGYSHSTGSDAFSMSQSGSSMSAEDRRAMIREANRLYTLYGESDKVVPLFALNVYEDD